MIHPKSIKSFFGIFTIGSNPYCSLQYKLCVNNDHLADSAWGMICNTLYSPVLYLGMLQRTRKKWIRIKTSELTQQEQDVWTTKWSTYSNSLLKIYIHIFCLQAKIPLPSLLPIKERSFTKQKQILWKYSGLQKKVRKVFFLNIKITFSQYAHMDGQAQACTVITGKGKLLLSIKRNKQTNKLATNPQVWGQCGRSVHITTRLGESIFHCLSDLLWFTRTNLQ